ncbi:FAD-dependent oxidoreductase [Microcoleus sp. FACHB-1515]|uniref:FAD-dependent oxidoreductase n=1 Tax=Cyanophyceae TaxID=3028117 RepID=UPI001686CBEA|nr:FAD-dependent oxidoreductase [Microcoleus sp. FACHB-1515]MBD2093209.1 FAD-dependent oxidoreductase [Microcoleus sp. FACHB-1515]
MNFDYDLVVIGAGPGGLAAAQRAASYGANVAIVERDQVGGTCVVHGCIPEKLMAYAASFMQFFQNADEYGWGSVSCQFDWSQFMKVKAQHIKHLSQVHRDHLQKARVKLLEGHAQFVDAHTLQIGGDRLTANKILIAVGGTAVKPNLSGSEQAITTRELLELPDRPDHLVIVGSNHIAVKAAGMMNALVPKVTLITLENQILPGYDDDLSATIQAELSKSGVQLICRSQVQRLERQQSCVKLTLSSDPSSSISASVVVWIEKRIPNLDGLNLEQAGVRLEQDAIAVDTYSRTSQPNIFAIGDCTLRPHWTPVAIASGRAFADAEFGNQPHIVSDESIPAVVSTQPEAATVGLSETQARNQFGNAVQCYRKTFQPLFNLMGESKQSTFLKIVVDPSSDRILGVHMMGEYASEIIQMVALAMKAGLTKTRLDQMIGIHPSIGEEFFTMN